MYIYIYEKRIDELTRELWQGQACWSPFHLYYYGCLLPPVRSDTRFQKPLNCGIRIIKFWLFAGRTWV